MLFKVISLPDETFVT